LLWKSRPSHLQIISVVSGVPDSSLKRLVSSSIRPWLSWRKVTMVWGKLVFSFSDWPSSTSTGGGLWTNSKSGSPPGSSAPPPSPSPLVSGPCGSGRLVGRMSSIVRFSLRSPSPYMGLVGGYLPRWISAGMGYSVQETLPAGPGVRTLLVYTPSRVKAWAS